MPDTEVKELYNRSSLGQSYGNSSAAPIGFGLLFMTVGGGIMIGANFLNDPNAPPVFVGVAFGGSFFLAGLLVLIGSVRAKMTRSRATARQGRQYWEVDFAWDPAGASSSSLKSFFGSLFAAAFLTVFLTPFNWIALSEKDAPYFVIGIIGLFDLIVVGLLMYGFYLLIRWWKYGTPRLEFERFPYFLGDSLNARFKSRSIGAFRAFTMTLRCITESTEGSGEDSKTVFRQIYADEIKIDKPGVHENLGDALPITFNLPLGDYGTKITGCSNPRYWEVEIHADTAGVDFLAQFLVPVYAREQTLTTEHTETTEGERE
jgi:hypothetical protein